MKKAKRIIVWFRKDLRLHDNEALTQALANSEEVIPVYVFNSEKLMGETLIGYQKTGKHRAKFLLESVAALRADFRALGIDLVIRFGKPEEEIFELAKATEANWVYANMERTQDEVQVQNALEKNLWSIGSEIQFFRGKMLYYTQDLPFPISHSPDIFNSFRKEVERFVPVRTPFDTPQIFPKWSTAIEVGELPALTDFGHQPFEPDERNYLPFVGGEAAGLARLETYFGERHLEQYRKQHLELQGLNNSSKLSPWLALGCLSPKLVCTRIKAYEDQHKSNKSTQEFLLELLVRDYLRLMGKKYGKCIFEEGGILGRETKSLVADEEKLQQWIAGKTEQPLINACMQQLAAVGYLSAKGRQLVSSYLVNDMHVDWRMGAAYFQYILIDYDICSNWVNWNIVGGVGPDPKDDKALTIENQQKKLDPQGEYLARWLTDSLQGA